MENINFRGIPTSLFLNGPNVEIVSDPQTGISIGSATTTTTDLSAAPPVVFDDHQCAYISATYDANANRVVIAYQDTSTNYGTAVVGNVVGTGITFGTPVTFETANTYWSSAVYDPSKQKVVIAYGENTPTGHYLAKARVGTVDPSDNSISFGSAVVFANTTIAYTDATYDSTNETVVFAWRDQDGFDLRGKAIVGTVVGTGITFGPVAVFNSTDSHYTRITYDPTNQKVVIAYQDTQQDSNNNYTYYPTAIVGTVSDSGPSATISFGNPTTIESNITGVWPAPIYDPISQKTVIFYGDQTNFKGRAVVGTISDTSISFGTPVEYESNIVGHNSPVYVTSSNKLVNTYSYGGNSQGKSFVATVVGTGITFGTAVDVGYGPYQSATYDSSNNKIVTAYRDDSQAGYIGKSVVVDIDAITTNFTTENYTDVVGLATFTGIATATFKQNPTAILDGGSIDFEWYYNGSRILDVSEDVTSGAGISTFDYVTGTGSTITISGKSSELNGKEVYFTVGYNPSAYQSETPVTAGTARSTGNAFNEPLQSTIATIGVKPEIEITNQPNPVFAPLNTAATYNIEARTIPGNGPVNYQWQLDGNDLADGKTRPTQVQDVDNLIGIITIVSQGITTTIDLSEVASYDQFIPGQQYTLTTDRDVIARFRLDGAAGGSSYLWPDQRGGRGGLSEGTITLLQGETYFLNVGERGKDYVAIDMNGTPANINVDGSGGWPGGGSGTLGWGGGGGGYTGLFLSTVSYETSLLIAGGGGGSSTGSVGSIGGNGGGLAGENGAFWGNWGQMGLGGTQNPPITPPTEDSPGGQSNGPGGALWPRTSPFLLGTSTFNGASGGGGGGGGYWGGGAGSARNLLMSSAGGGGSGHINDSVVSDGTTIQGQGSSGLGAMFQTGEGYARMDFISTAKDVVTEISGSQTNNLSIKTNNSAAGVIRCKVSADIDVVESPVFSRSVSYYTTDARSIVNIEEITTESGIITEVNLANVVEFVFEASSNDTEPPKLYSFYSTEKDLKVQMDLYGGMGKNSPGPNSSTGVPSIGGEGGKSTIEFTMKQNVEYVLAGLIPGVNAPFLYEKARLIAVVGAGGGGGRGGDGGLGGGCGISGGKGIGSGDSGFGGATLQDQLTDVGIFGSSLQASVLYGADTQAQGSDGGRTITCTKGGVYWRGEDVVACDDVGNVQFRLPDGSIVVPSGTIERGYKAGYNIMQTGGLGVDVLDANGGAGVSGGMGASASSGGGGGAGYNANGTITVISTERGGSTFAQARVVMRITM